MNHIQLNFIDLQKLVPVCLAVALLTSLGCGNTPVTQAPKRKLPIVPENAEQDGPPTVGDPEDAMANGNISNKEKFESALTNCRFAIKASRRTAMYFYDGGLEKASQREKEWKASIIKLREKSALYLSLIHI